MSLIESIVEDPALEWFGELGGCGRARAAERDLFGEVVLARPSGG
jgi:hypothetical protein